MSELELCRNLVEFIVHGMLKSNRAVHFNENGELVVFCSDIFNISEFACGYPLMLDALFDELNEKGIEVI